MQIQRLGQDGDIPRRLIEAASEVFARHGFAGTRVREIVRAADVNLASVNYYFGGKEGLYAATLKQLAAERRQQMPQLPDAHAGNAEEALRHQVFTILERFVDGGERSTLGRILAHESMNPTAYFDQIIGDIVRPELDRMRELVQQLMPRGTEPEVVTRTAMSIMGQCLFYLFARGAVERLHPKIVTGRDACERLARHITGFSLAGIREAGRAAKA